MAELDQRGHFLQLMVRKHRTMIHDIRKPVFRVLDQVRHKQGYTTTEDGYGLEISYLGRIEIVLSM